MNEPVLEKWNESHASVGRETASAIVDVFDRVLSDAFDERPLQTLFASYANLLAPLAPPGSTYWCLDRPRFGAEFVPDFLLASRTSSGFRWTMVELESPNERVLTKSGLPAKKLAEALKQIRDWRMWLTDNVAYARDQLGLKDIEAICPSYVIIGRRGSLDPKQAKTYRALSTDGTTVMSYDRLRDLVHRGLYNNEGNSE
ncbi:MAG: DUF4263 domain-containing protein [Candidatus Scalindua sp.]|nr:DUF4263 domain-containing protein [Candidatus Scalindua sp.]